MSVQSPIYILWGLMLPYPKGDWLDECHGLLEPFIDSPHHNAPLPGATILLDGMGGKYVAVGHVLARSGPHGDDLGTHTIPMLYPAFDPLQDPETVKRFAGWRTDIEAALRATSLDVLSLGKAFGWHVVQHYR